MLTELENETRPAFITGSRAYGIPRPDSDLDLVVLVSEECRDKIVSVAGGKSKVFPRGDAKAFFGKLNLILVVDPSDYDSWEHGTRELKRREQPVSRDDAVKLFTTLGLTNQVSNGPAV